LDSCEAMMLIADHGLKNILFRTLLLKEYPTEYKDSVLEEICYA